MLLDRLRRASSSRYSSIAASVSCGRSTRSSYRTRCELAPRVTQLLRRLSAAGFSTSAMYSSSLRRSGRPKPGQPRLRSKARIESTMSRKSRTRKISFASGYSSHISTGM